MHVLLLLAVAHQLVGNYFIDAPLPGEEAQWPFILHEATGLVTLGLVTLFWIWTLLRNSSETRLSQLIPWFSKPNRGALWRDAAGLLREALSLKPPSDEHSLVAAAIHGLGLAMASIMAATGALWLLFFSESYFGKVLILIHKLSANLMLAYLILHASAAILHQLLGADSFSRMFWFRPKARAKRIETP